MVPQRCHLLGLGTQIIIYQRGNRNGIPTLSITSTTYVVPFTGERSVSRAWRRAARAVVGGVGRGRSGRAAAAAGGVSLWALCSVATSPTEENRHCVKIVVLVAAPKRPIRDSDCHIYFGASWSSCRQLLAEAIQCKKRKVS